MDIEKRLAALKPKIEAEQKKHAEYSENLTECIPLRNLQILPMCGQLKTRDEVISDVKRQMVASDDKITQLLTKV